MDGLPELNPILRSLFFKVSFRMDVAEWNSTTSSDLLWATNTSSDLLWATNTSSEDEFLVMPDIPAWVSNLNLL